MSGCKMLLPFPAVVLVVVEEGIIPSRQKRSFAPSSEPLLSVRLCPIPPTTSSRASPPVICAVRIRSMYMNGREDMSTPLQRCNEVVRLSPQFSQVDSYKGSCCHPVPEQDRLPVLQDDGLVVLAADVAADVVALRQAGHVALAPRVEEQEKLKAEHILVSDLHGQMW